MKKIKKKNARKGCEKSQHDKFTKARTELHTLLEDNEITTAEAIALFELVKFERLHNAMTKS